MHGCTWLSSQVVKVCTWNVFMKHLIYGFRMAVPTTMIDTQFTYLNVHLWQRYHTWSAKFLKGQIYSSSGRGDSLGTRLILTLWSVTSPKPDPGTGSGYGARSWRVCAAQSIRSEAALYVGPAPNVKLWGGSSETFGKGKLAMNSWGAFQWKEQQKQ